MPIAIPTRRRAEWLVRRRPIKKHKRDRLEGAGWKVGEAADSLEPTEEEAAFVELKVALAGSLEDRRQLKKWG